MKSGAGGCERSSSRSAAMVWLLGSAGVPVAGIPAGLPAADRFEPLFAWPTFPRFGSAIGSPCLMWEGRMRAPAKAHYCACPKGEIKHASPTACFGYMKMSSPNCSVKMSPHGTPNHEQQGDSAAGSASGRQGRQDHEPGGCRGAGIGGEFRRLRRRFEAQGSVGLVHRSRGRQSPKRLPEALRRRVARLIKVGMPGSTIAI